MDKPTVKEIKDGYEVKLGAGILPIQLTSWDMGYSKMLASPGTFSIPTQWTSKGISIYNINNFFKAIAAVNKYLDEKK